MARYSKQFQDCYVGRFVIYRDAIGWNKARDCATKTQAYFVADDANTFGPFGRLNDAYAFVEKRGNDNAQR